MRLIDADAIPEKEMNYPVWVCLKKQPTIDAVPVVRCGECKHWNDETVYHPFCNHPTSGLFTAPDDGTGFCHCGERKDGKE